MDQLSLTVFQNHFDALLKSLSSKSNDAHLNVSHQLYQEGIEYIRNHTRDFAECEMILYQLMSVFTHNPELYYFMGCIRQTSFPDQVASILYWFQSAFQQFHLQHQTDHPYYIETILDMFKLLFDNHQLSYIQYLMDMNRDYLAVLLEPPVDARWLLFLGAYYIKTNQLKQADRIYSQLLESDHASKDMQYKILNNCLIMYTRMANFDIITELLKRNFELCHSMVNEPLVDISTKKNVFCSNMLQYDYVYHDPRDRIHMNRYVETYFPVQPFQSCPTSSEDILLDFSMTAPQMPPKIRIGYVSSDFIFHAVSHFILPILERHDLSRFEVVLFFSQNYSVFASDPLYKHIYDRCRTVNIKNLSTVDAVDAIRRERIDILFDLNGFTEGHRLDVFASRPAPIQVAYLGYPNTVGSRNIIQYRLTDRVADSPESQQWFAETRLYLPRCFLLYQSIVQKTPLAFLNGHSPFFPWVVLGALNRESKNSEPALLCWRAIMEQAPHTKILIKLSTVEDDDIHMAKYKEKLGVDERRIIFAKYGSTAEYYQLFSAVDILLDAFPYSGTTTTCDAMYNSVPVVTLRHRDMHAHNVTSSILTHAGFPELVADSMDEYVKKVVQLSKDTARLVAYRGDERGPGRIHHGFMELMRPDIFMRDYEDLLVNLFKGAVARSGT